MNINLLPWREEKRKVKNKIFYGFSSLVILLSIMILILMHVFVHLKLKKEVSKIDNLNIQLKIANEKMKETQSLQESKNEITHRRKLIQTLQSDRISIVKLLDKLVRLVPEGIYLNEVSRKSTQNTKDTKPIYSVAIQGNAQTSSLISVFLKNLENEPWISNERLEKVAINKKGLGLIFKLNFTHDD